MSIMIKFFFKYGVEKDYHHYHHVEIEQEGRKGSRYVVNKYYHDDHRHILLKDSRANQKEMGETVI